MKLYSKLVNSITVFIFISMVTIVLLQILFRFSSTLSISWTEELSRYLFVWVVYLGGIATVKKGMNITFDILIDSLPYGLWKYLFSFTCLMSGFFLAVIAYLGIQTSIVVFGQVSSMLRIPMGLVYLAIPIGAAGMLLSQIQYWLETLKVKKAENQKGQFKEDFDTPVV
ncbi:TRAP transporter small permease [Bacillus infantis]|uniref:TRAP transporter small permease n=1 Tax=Bacillus infantis TaxID=324767 RepID=UPI003CEFD55C